MRFECGAIYSHVMGLVCVCERESESERKNVCLHVCVCERERARGKEYVCARVYVCVRESVYECDLSVVRYILTSWAQCMCV